jgi:hypothetical protein
LLALALFIPCACQQKTPPKGGPPAIPPGAATKPVKEVQIDLDKAVAVALPEIKENLTPVAFRTPDQKGGWAIRIPGNRPIATPAYADGLRQLDGAVTFMYSFAQPMAFQPCLSGGNVYAPTVNGLIICLKTGSRDADGWTAWGGNAQHNKTH